MTILDAVADWSMGGPLPSISAQPCPDFAGYFDAYVEDKRVGYACRSYKVALAVAAHARLHWLQLPHQSPKQTWLQVSGEPIRTMAEQYEADWMREATWQGRTL